MLDDRALRYMSVVARLGSIRAAARELGLAASAVQRTVAAAERHVGMRLFERGVRGVLPTEAGRIVASQARDRDDLGVRLAAQLSDLRGLASGQMTLAAGEGFLAEIWQQVLDPFLADHPGVNAAVYTAGSDDLVRLLATDEADVAVVLHPQPDPQIQVVASREEPLHVICPPDHPFACLPAVQPEQLEGVGLAMLPRRFGIRVLQDQLLRAYGVAVVPRLESTSQAMIINAVRHGQTLALLPTVTVREFLTNGEVVAVPVADPHVSRVQAKLLIRRGRWLLPATRTFVHRCAQTMFNMDDDAGS